MSKRYIRVTHDCGQTLLGRTHYDPETFEYKMIWCAPNHGAKLMACGPVCPECGGEVSMSKQEVVEPCPFCALARGDVSQHKTEWFALHAAQEPYGIVVEDLDPKGYAMRVLGVPLEHHACGEEPPIVRRSMLGWMREVSRNLCEERGLEVARVDVEDHSFEAHTHYQICLRRKHG